MLIDKLNYIIKVLEKIITILYYLYWSLLALWIMLIFIDAMELLVKFSIILNTFTNAPH